MQIWSKMLLGASKMGQYILNITRHGKFNRLKIYKDDFFADNKSSSSKEKLPKIPKSNSGDFWR